MTTTLAPLPILINGKWGYIDTSGRIVISPRFSEAFMFQEGLAVIVVGNKWGFIDPTGREVISPTFHEATSFYEGLACVLVGKQWGYIDTNGTLVIPPRFNEKGVFRNGLSWHMFENGLRGYIDRDGNTVIKSIYKYCGDFSEGLAYVMYGDRYGFIDTTGDFVIMPAFEEADSFHESLARIRTQGKYGFINRSGQVVIEPHFDYAQSFSEGLAAVTMDWPSVLARGRRGYIDTTGELRIVNSLFMSVMEFTEGLAAARIEDQVGIQHKYCFIDKNGTMVVPPRFYRASSFCNGIARVWLEPYSGQGYINREGEFIWRSDAFEPTAIW
jgi:hypothetical protein